MSGQSQLEERSASYSKVGCSRLRDHLLMTVIVDVGAKLVDVVVLQSAVFCSVDVMVQVSGARLSSARASARWALLFSKFIARFWRSIALSARRNLALGGVAVALMAAAVIPLMVGTMVQVGSGAAGFVGFLQLAVAVLILSTTARVYTVLRRVRRVTVLVVVTRLGVEVRVGLRVVDGIVIVTAGKVVTKMSVVVLV